MKALLIAEKASLMRAVQAAYNLNGFKDQVDFFALHGHIMSLYDPGEYQEAWVKWSFDTLPLIPQNFRYKVSDRKLYDELKARIDNGNYDYLINCCDPDREGQHIFYSVYETMGCSLPVRRMWHNDLSDRELTRALNQMEDDLAVERLVNLKTASKLRAQMDWLVGMNASRIVTLKRRSVTRLGRVMTPTFKILADREKAIRSFNASTSYGIDAAYEEGFKARLVTSEDGKKYEPVSFGQKTDAEQMIEQLSSEGIVQSIESKETKDMPPSLPSLADIQAEANKAFGYTLDATLAYVQNLYEKKLVSYPRTDCCYVTKEVAKDFDKILQALKPTKSIGPFVEQITQKEINAVIKNKDYVNDEKVTAHYALIPTGTLKAQLSDEEKKIFELICKRFACIFLPPYKVKRTKVMIDADGWLFMANGSVILQKGYRELLGLDKKDEELPVLSEGQRVHVKEYLISEHTTKAPGRFTDASLLNAMINAANYIQDKEMADILKGDQKVKDSGGIGTPATRAAIVGKIVQPITNKEGMTYFLAYRKNKSFYVTDEGLDLADSLQSFDIASPELTAKWEKKLRSIEDGEIAETDFVDEMISYTKDMTAQMMEQSFAKVSGTFLKCRCPVCGGRMKAVNNYYICEYYKKEDGCTFVLPKIINGAQIKEKQVSDLCEGTEVPAMKMKSPKTGKDFYAGLKYNAETKRIDYVLEENHFTKASCPICGKRIAMTQNYYHCENYKAPQDSCTFIIGRKLNHAAISEKTLLELCQGNQTQVLKMKSPKTGNEFYAALKFNPEEHKIDLIFEQDHDTKAQCPVCKGRIFSSSRYYLCENYRTKTCSFILPKEFRHAAVSEKMLKELCEGKTTKAVKIKSDKTGKSYYAGLKFNPQTNNIDLEFEDGHPTKYKCPVCGGNLLKKSGDYGDYLICENSDFNVRYMISGRKMKESEIQELLEKGELKCSGFTGRNGKPFSSKLVIENGRVGFYFGKKGESD